MSFFGALVWSIVDFFDYKKIIEEGDKKKKAETTNKIESELVDS